MEAKNKLDEFKKSKQPKKKKKAQKRKVKIKTEPGTRRPYKKHKPSKKKTPSKKKPRPFKKKPKKRKNPMMNYPNPFKLKEPLNNPMTAGMGMQLPPPIQQPKVMPPLEPDTPTGGAKKRKQQTKGTNPKKKCRKT